jgi:hypothetical protein
MRSSGCHCRHARGFSDCCCCWCWLSCFVWRVLSFSESILYAQQILQHCCVLSCSCLFSPVKHTVDELLYIGCAVQIRCITQQTTDLNFAAPACIETALLPSPSTASMHAAAPMRAAAVPACPSFEAKCRGVLCSASTAVVRAPRSRRRCVASTCPCLAV